MPHRVNEILIVASSYDAFTMEEDGGLMEYVFSNYQEVSLGARPRFTMVSSIKAAIEEVSSKEFDLVVMMPRYLEEDAVTLAKDIKMASASTNPQLSLVLLVHGGYGIGELTKNLPTMEDSIDKTFVWFGNRNILWAIIKCLEDQMNVQHDTNEAMVRVLILVEDSPLYYSSLLPLIYEALEQQTNDILEEGLNEEHRLLRLKARPKLLLASNYEEAIQLYNQFHPYILGIFSDVRFPRENVLDNKAGIELLKLVHADSPYTPLLLLSSDPSNGAKAQEIGAFFLDKNSPTLHLELRHFLRDHLGFGDFVFRTENGDEVGRVSNLAEMERALPNICEESLHFHASTGHHFSSWFLARFQIELASKVREAKYKDFSSIQEVKNFLIKSIRESRILQQKGVVTSFNGEQFDPEIEFLKIGNGSLGGKARGLAFMLKCIQQNDELFKKLGNNNLLVTIPKTLVITTEIYDQFIEDNHLEEFVECEYPDEIVAARFLESRFSKELENDLTYFLEKVRYPLAVRSSGLFEDGQFQSCAGLYKTYMLPNNAPELYERLRQLLRAIKLVYASIFYKAPRTFCKITHQRIEEEKMAVTIQEVAGQRFGRYYYPTISGTAQSRNFYPIGHAKAEEGIARMCLGLGKTVVEGGQSLSFFPQHPQFLPHFSLVNSIIKNSQKNFLALNLSEHECYHHSTPHPSNGKKGKGHACNPSSHCPPNCDPPGGNSNLAIKKELWIADDINLVRRPVEKALKEGASSSLFGSYLMEDNNIIDGQVKGGIPILNFASILKYNLVPLPLMLSSLLDIGKEGLGRDVELEWALNIYPQGNESNRKNTFILLQMRPLAHRAEELDINITSEEIKQSICYTVNALGRGRSAVIYDLIFVIEDKFTFQHSVQVAKEISEYNASLEKEKRPYILIGPGRWGSSDTMLGIPVKWEDISGVCGIVEVPYGNMKIDPSQGTHFFQNIISSGVIYLTVYSPEDFLNQNWLYKQTVIKETAYIRHIRLSHPCTAKVDSKKGLGIIKIM